MINGHLVMWGACWRTKESRESASWRRAGKNDRELLFVLRGEMMPVHGGWKVEVVVVLLGVGGRWRRWWC